LLRGLANLRLQKYDQALADLDKALSGRDGAGARRERAELHAGFRRWELAAADYTEALGRRPDNPRALLGRARVYAVLGRKEAIADYARLIEAVPQQPILRLEQARYLLKQQRWDEAAEAFERVLRQDLARRERA